MCFIFIGVKVMALEITEKGTFLIDETEYPAVGFGTYPYKENICYKAVSEAAEAGYRIIDTATFYRNLEPIGQVLKKYGRENFYIISKVWPDSHTPQQLNKDIQATLKELQTSYLDLYFLHWPNSDTPIEDTLQAMDKLRMQGIIRHIGLSNVTVNHLKRALEVGVPIKWIQVEMHPFFYEPQLLEFCQKNDIYVQAWAPLRRGSISHETSLEQLGKKHGKTAAQVALRWILQHQCIPLPGSQNKQHIQENFDVFDFALSQEEMAGIDKIAKKGKRERFTKDMGLGFADEFDFTYEECWPKKNPVKKKL